MSEINRIDVRVVTGTKSDAGTNGDVYIGVAGREFYVDSVADDFENGSDRTYTLGVGANVLHAAQNDPRNPQLQTTDLDKFPEYLRFEPAGDNAEWNLERIDVTVNPGPSQIRFSRLAGGPDLWLRQRYGKVAYLNKA